MKFNQTMKLSTQICTRFWEGINDSYRMEEMFEECKNVQVTLKDRYRKCQFIYYRAKTGKGLRILNIDNECIAVLWIHPNGEMGGTAEGERGKRRAIQCLKMFEKSLESGYVEMEIEKNPLPPSIYIPLSEREEIIVEMLKNGTPFQEVREKLELTPLKIRKIKKSLIKKGVIESSFEEIA